MFARLLAVRRNLLNELVDRLELDHWAQVRPQLDLDGDTVDVLVEIEDVDLERRVHRVKRLVLADGDDADARWLAADAHESVVNSVGRLGDIDVPRHARNVCRREAEHFVSAAKSVDDLAGESLRKVHVDGGRTCIEKVVSDRVR